MSHFQIPATTQSNSRYGGASFYNTSTTNTSLQKSQLSYSGNTSFNCTGASSMLYQTKCKKIPSRNTCNHTFSIPIQCGKASSYDNPDLELWSNPHVTKLKTGNNRRIVCGGLSWDIYIHPNQGENGNEFALSVFPVKTSIDDKLPDNYKLKYSVSSSLNARGSPPIGQMDDDQKSVSKFDAKWHREVSHVVYDANPGDITAKQENRRDIDWRSTMERLPFSTSDLIQYNCDDNDYFNLYISINTAFIKKPVKRSQYSGVLGAILLQSESKLEEQCKEIDRLNHKKDEFIMSLQKQLQTANKLNFKLSENQGKMATNIEKYASEMQELRHEIQNIANRNKQSVTQKEKTIMHLQDDIVIKTTEITKLMNQITKLKEQKTANDSMAQLMQQLQTQQIQSQTQHDILQSHRVQQQQQYAHQLLTQQNAFHQSPYNPFSIQQQQQPQQQRNTSTTTVVMDQSPQQPQQSPSYQARVVSQPSFNANTSYQPPPPPPMPQIASPPQITDNFTFNKDNVPHLEPAEEKKEETTAQQGLETSNGTTSDKITDTIDTMVEEQVFEHRPVRAWRYDEEQKKWRGRGKGQLMIYFNKEKNIGKMVFTDEKHNKTRLLQYIDGTSHCEYSTTDADNKGDEVEWHGADYTMDNDEPMIGKWKIALIEDAESAKEFKNIFNDFIDSNTNQNDKESMSSIKPFSFSDNKESMSSFVVNDNETAFTFSNSLNPQIGNQWANAFKGSDDNNDNNNTVSSFTNIDWGFDNNNNETKKEDETQKNEDKDKDNGLQNTFKAIVELSEQKVDTGHECETLIAAIPFTKLYRFGKDVSQQPCWKIRASQSKVYFYESNANSKIRIIAREHETNKLRMNQWIPKTDDAEFGLKQNKVYQWNAYDSSIAAEEENESAGFTCWCIKFESAQNAESFAKEFEGAMKVNECLTKNDGLLQSPQRIEDQIIEKQHHETNEEWTETNQEWTKQQDETNDEESAEYKGWTEEEIAEDKRRKERAKQAAETAKLFKSSNDDDNTVEWAMNDVFGDKDAIVQNMFTNYNFEDQRGVDLEAEKILNKIETDPSISFGIAPTDDNETNDDNNDDNTNNTNDNIEEMNCFVLEQGQNGDGDSFTFGRGDDDDNANVTQRDNNNDNIQEEQGLGMNCFAFDTTNDDNANVTQRDNNNDNTEQGMNNISFSAGDTMAKGNAVSWGDLSGGFSSVKATEGFGNVSWSNNDESAGFGSFDQSNTFNIDTLNAMGNEDKPVDDGNDNNNEDDNGTYTLKPIVDLVEVEVESGHENDKILESFDVLKLYRWGKDVSQQPCWKNRASKTSLKFYQNNESGKIRVVCRENITNKLRLNQWVGCDSNIKKMNEKQISWSGVDATIEEEDDDEKGGFCMFAAKFSDQEIADKFYKFFVSASENNLSLNQ